MLNHEVLKNISKKKGKIVIVTKYWDTQKTKKIREEIQNSYPDIFLWLGENRIKQIKKKNIPRENIHFIGNIQSQKIADIVKYCSTIHSLSSLKHAKKIESQWLKVRAFIQIRLDTEKNIWVLEYEVSEFLEISSQYKYLKIVGISWMWVADCWIEEKRKEFQKLISIRDTYLPSWRISAWTSRDYAIALEEWIDIVRVWSKALV